MNSSKFIPRPLANANYPVVRTLNLYKTAFRDPSRNGTFRTLDWEKPSVRIANTITWLLRNARKQGLALRHDGYARVQDLLKHPRLMSLDFPAIERAVQRFRSDRLRLTYAPRNTPHRDPSPDSQLNCWWIGLQPTTREEYTDKRIIDPDEVPDMIYHAPTTEWPSLSRRGISRGSSPDITLSTQNTLPIHYMGDHTFIRMNPHKILTHSDIKLYRSRTITPKRGNEIKETVTSPAPNISPKMFEAAMRVVVQRFPLVLLDKQTSKKGRKKRKKEERRFVVEQPGLNALRRFGYGDVIDGSRLAVIPKKQQKEKETEKEEEEKRKVMEKRRQERKVMEKQQQERERRRPTREKERKGEERKENQSEVQEGKVKDTVKAKEPEKQTGSESRSRGRHQMKDPPPHSTIKLESESPS